MRLRLVNLFYCFTILAPLYSQTLDFNDPGKRLTPSPVVSSLGVYGGADVKKSTGGIYKSINLFELKEGLINYSPSIEYFSTGVKVDDWGGRVGIGWSDNFTGVIYRIVRSVPDENATERSDAVQPAAFQEDTRANWEYLKRAHVGIENGAGLDTEYDLFSYHVLGESGSFIIRQGQAVLLNHQQGVTIQVLTVSPYTFCLTKPDGIKYYFGLNGETEVSANINDNVCDEGAPYVPPSATAWFLNKIVSPNKDELNFTYGPVNYEYTYNYNETYNLKNGNEGDTDNPCPDAYLNESHNTYCTRRKHTSTRFLQLVSGTNFSLSFNYRSRSDLPNEKLISRVDLLDKNGQLVSQVSLSYDETVSNFPVEFQLGQVVSPLELPELKTRYFLKELSIGLSGNPANREYDFLYHNPGQLPHRFSFSQDIAGYYNGTPNQGFIPSDQAQEHLDWQFPLYALPNLAYRGPSPVFSRVGLLTKIVYPTGGTDSFTYEGNSYTATEEELVPGIPYQGTYTNPANAQNEIEAASEIFTVPFSQTVRLNFYTGYGGQQLPYDNDGSFYWVKYKLWNVTANTEVTSETLLVLYEQRAHDIQLAAGVQYQLRYTVYGERSMAQYLVTYSAAKNYIKVEKPYYGQRVKEIRSNGLYTPEIVRSFNYKSFERNGQQIVFSDQTSTHTADVINLNDGINGFGYFYTTEIKDPCPYLGPPPGPPPPNIHYIIYRKLASSSVFDINIYQGSPVAYDCVTEFLDQGTTSFIASQYMVTSDEAASWLRGDYWAFVPMSNAGWNHGLEADRYYGNHDGVNFNIQKEQHWSYTPQSSTEQVFFNYLISQKYTPLLVYSDALMDRNLWAYTVVAYPSYGKWFKLDSFTEVDHFSDGQTYTASSSGTTYRYNPSDKLLWEEEVHDSKGNKITKRFNRPRHMVDAGLDPQGTYQSMVNNLIFDPVIEQIDLKNDNQLSLTRTNYYAPHAGIYVPETVETKIEANTPEIRVQYYQYDDRGNPLSLSKAGDVVVNYIYGYNKTLPVAKIEGPAYSDVLNIFGGSITLQGENGQNLSAAQITSLRSSLPHAQITTYTYKPLVGMSSMTDPNGKTTYYEYDPLGRLSLIKDEAQRILQAFEYHYQSRN